MSDTQRPAAALAQPEAGLAVPDTELLRRLQMRGSVRNYKPDPVPDPWVNAIIAAGQRAPTSSNIQAYSIVVVRNAEAKARLAELAGNQKHIVECPVFFAICADLTRPAYACELHGEDFVGHTMEKSLVATIDAALVGMSMSLAADSMGLGTVMIGGMRNAPLEVAELLKLPKRVYVVFGLCVGWPKSAPVPKPRQSLATVVHQETYNSELPEAELAAYDAELAQYYTALGRETPEQSWTRTMADSLSKPRRMQLREQLKTLGFDFE